MQRVVARRDAVFDLAHVRLVSGAENPSRWVQAPTHRGAQLLKSRYAVRCKALASAS